MEKNKNYLVIGGTGKTGRKVVTGLKARNLNVRIGTRSSTTSFDWEDSSTWPEVLSGINTVYIVYYPDLAVPGAYEAIDGFIKEAKSAGVTKAVLLSGKGEKEAERCEQLVAKSGLDYTLVRASWFNQNFSEGFFLEPILAGHVALPMPNAKIPFVDTNDIADVVIQAMIGDAHNEMLYEVTGPRKLTFQEAVTEIAKETGRVINFQAISLEAYKEGMKLAGLSSEYIWLIDYLFRHVLANEENQVVSNDVQKVLGRRAKDFSEYVKETVKTEVWNPPVSVF